MTIHQAAKSLSNLISAFAGTFTVEGKVDIDIDNNGDADSVTIGTPWRGCMFSQDPRNPNSWEIGEVKMNGDFFSIERLKNLSIDGQTYETGKALAGTSQFKIDSFGVRTLENKKIETEDDSICRRFIMGIQVLASDSEGNEITKTIARIPLAYCKGLK